MFELNKIDFEMQSFLIIVFGLKPIIFVCPDPRPEGRGYYK